jgi:hypothetical protein
VGKEGNTPFIAMQFVDGGSLDKLLERRSALPLSQKVGFVVQVCRALEYAHKHGVIHRDIKPGNVMLMSDGTVKVVDFGIARFGDTGKTQTGLILGTLPYMSPQLFRNIVADARSDIWATGIMFYEILAGQRPFQGDNPGTLMANIMMQELPSITAAAPGTSREVAAVIERMLNKEPEQRYQSMEEVLIALEPVWKDLQREEVSRLVQDAEDLRRRGNLREAQAKAKEAYWLDTASTRAKSILDQINEEIKKSQVRPEAEKHVEMSQKHLDAGQLEEARAEAEFAKHLDPSFQRVLDMLERVQAAEELAQKINLAQRRLAEGSLTEAELQLTRVLEIDASNAVAQDLLKQIREEKTRQERHRRLSETLHRARAFWTELRYDECIELLLAAQEEFPGEPKIKELLETARQDQTEQWKQSLFIEARNFLRSQKFDDALTILDRVLRRFPSDLTAKNLRALAIQGREQQIREVKLKEDLANLRALVNAEKYQEAITRGERLLLEFPKEFELTEIITYARSEQARLEQKGRLEGWLEKVNQGIKAGRFGEAIQAVEMALREFPRNSDLLELQKRAKTQKEEKEKLANFQRRMKELDMKIDSGKLTDAFQTVNQTIAEHGPNPELARRLTYLQFELEQREKKKQEQKETIESAKTLAESGDFGGATMILDHAVETGIMSDSDPLLGDLRQDIRTKQSSQTPPKPKPAGEGPEKLTTPSRDSGIPYSPRGGGALLDDQATLIQNSATSVFSPDPNVGGQPAQPVVPTLQPLETTPTGKAKESKQQVQAPVQAFDLGATIIVQPGTQEEESKPSLYEPRVSETTQRQAEPLPATATRPFWKQPLAIAGLCVALVAGAYFALRHPTPPPPPPPNDDSSEWAAAQQFVQQKPYSLSQALQKYQAVVDFHGSHEQPANQEITRIKGDQQQAATDMKQGGIAQQNQKWDDAIKDYNAAKTIDRDVESEANQDIKDIGELKEGKTRQQILEADNKQAEKDFADKQWDKAKAEFSQVRNAPEADPAIRSNADEKLKLISAHLEEDDLFRKANGEMASKQFDQARADYQELVKRNGDHLAEATQQIKIIDAMVAKSNTAAVLKTQIENDIGAHNFADARNKYKEYLQYGSDGATELSMDIENGEDKWFVELKGRIDPAKKTQDQSAIDSLNSLSKEFMKIGGAGGRNAGEANEIASKQIPADIADIRKAMEGAHKRQEDEQWNLATADFEAAVKIKDANSMSGKVTAEFQGIFNGHGSHATEANEYLLKRIPDAIALFQPPKKIPPDPTAEAAIAIKKILGDLASAMTFDKKSKIKGDEYVNAIKHVWPKIPQDNADAYKNKLFDPADSYSLKFTPGQPAFNGDTADVDGSFSASIGAKSLKPQPSTGTFHATFKKSGDQWILDTFKTN